MYVTIFSLVPCFPGTTIHIMNVAFYRFVIATPNPKRFRYKIDPVLWPNEPVELPVYTAVDM